MSVTQSLRLAQTSRNSLTCYSTTITAFFPPLGLGTYFLAVGSSTLLPSTMKQYSWRPRGKETYVNHLTPPLQRSGVAPGFHWLNVPTTETSRAQQISSTNRTARRGTRVRVGGVLGCTSFGCSAALGGAPANCAVLGLADVSVMIVRVKLRRAYLTCRTELKPPEELGM